MIDMVATLSSQQQTIWATLAQVNAAVIIALVVEIGVAARRHQPRDILAEDVRSGISIVINLLVAFVYIVGGGLAVTSLAQSLLFLASLDNTSSGEVQQVVVATLGAVLLALLGPLIVLADYIVRSIAEGAIETGRLVLSIRKSRRTERSGPKKKVPAKPAA